MVRSFRAALSRGERPEIEDYLPAGDAHRNLVLFELLHEKMEVRIKAGEPFSLESCLARFPDLARDPHAVSELLSAELELRRRAQCVPETAASSAPIASAATTSGM